MKDLLFLGLSLVLVGSPAFAESSEEMLSACKPFLAAKIVGEQITMPPGFEAGTCWGAFGVVQSAIVKASADGRPLFKVCAPTQSTRNQLIAVFVEYATKNPQRLHEDFFDLTINSLEIAFPCTARAR